MLERATTGSSGAWRPAVQAAWRQPVEQKRWRAWGWKARPQTGQTVVAPSSRAAVMASRGNWMPIPLLFAVVVTGATGTAQDRDEPLVEGKLLLGHNFPAAGAGGMSPQRRAGRSF